MFEPEWQHPPEPLVWAEQEIHIWRASLNVEPETLRRYAQVLSLDEQQRADRFRFERDRHRFIASRGIVRSLLGRYLQLEASCLRFCYGTTGKPALEAALNTARLEFNLSHSQNLMLGVVTTQHPVGVDLEGLRSLTDLSGLTQRFFSPREHAAIQSLPDDQQSLAFFRYWTCKEAILKATGSGLVNLSQVEIRFQPDGGAIAHLGNFPTTLSLYPFTPAPGYAAAIAFSQSQPVFRFWQWSPDEPSPYLMGGGESENSPRIGI